MGPVLGPHPAPTLREQKLHFSLGTDVGWPVKGAPVREGPPLPLQQLMSQTPESSWGPKCRVTLTPPVIETDRGVALPHNAQASLLSSSSFHFLKSLCLLVPWAWSLSHSRQTLPIKFKTEASGERVWCFRSLPPLMFHTLSRILICLGSR